LVVSGSAAICGSSIASIAPVLPSNRQDLVEETDLGRAIARADVDPLGERGIRVTEDVSHLPIEAEELEEKPVPRGTCDRER
jgi:hypothetical protein